MLQNQCTPFALSWISLKPRSCNRNLWLLTLGCTIWSIWFLRNKIKFEGGSVDRNRFFNTLKICVRTWAEELLGGLPQ